MVTRRTAVGAGLAFASLACTAGFDAYGAPVRRSADSRSIDALFIDETIEIPRQLAALIKADKGAAAVVEIRLDAAAQAGLARLLDMSQAIAGVSSGAALFCLERIGWDHGFRLTGRSEWCAGHPGDDARRRDVAAFLCGAHLPAVSSSPSTRAYRPSRADGTLHAWVMQKSASPRLGQGRREA